MTAYSRPQVTTPEALPDERLTDAALRPSRLDEFVGQAKVKESLQIAIDAAKQRREPLDHTLIFGPPGLGKTTLALLMAKELGVNLRTTSGPVLEKPGDLVGLLTSLGSGDMLFIDEIHRMKPALEEFLYPAMEDFRVDVRISEGPHAQTIPMALERHGDRLRVRALGDAHVHPEVLHGRIEEFLERRLHPVDLVDEEHVARTERGEQPHQVAGLLEHGARGGAE